VDEHYRDNSASVMFAHNHPPGIVELSRFKATITKALKSALCLEDIRLLNRFIMAGN
jgi:DNA repair protein RadC